MDLMVLISKRRSHWVLAVLAPTSLEGRARPPGTGQPSPSCNRRCGYGSRRIQPGFRHSVRPVVPDVLPTTSAPVRLGYRRPLGAHDRQEGLPVVAGGGKPGVSLA